MCLSKLIRGLLTAILPAAVLLAPAAAAQQAADSPVVLEQAAATAGDPAPSISRQQALRLVSERLTPGHQTRLQTYVLSEYSAGLNHVFQDQQGTGNLAVVEQDGLSNLAVMYQHGHGNTTRLWQSGIGNLYGSWLRGDDNTLEVVQAGDGNVYLRDFTGSGYTPGLIEQIGDGNQLIELGASTTTFSVRQAGDGLSMIIQHHGYRP